MAHRGPRGRAGHGGSAGIGKKIEHGDGAVCLADALHAEIPVGGLLREKAGVLEVHGFDLKGEVPISDLPLLGHILLFPLAASGGGTGISGVGTAPQRVLPGSVPDGLGIGPHQDAVAPSLQLFPSAAVDELIVAPFIREPHTSGPPCFHANHLIIS